MENLKLDRRRKYWLILDCETATLPLVNEYPPDDRKTIAIAKPLIYDLGWQIIDNKGNVYSRRSYLISEIFSVPAIFDTAYYASKRPIYLEKLEKNEIILTDWKTATKQLEYELSLVQAVGAYNSMFDFKKAIPFTELYINSLYSSHYYEWEEIQRKSCNAIVYDKQKTSNSNFDPMLFKFRGKVYPLFDVWGLSCKHILNNDNYKNFCLRNDYLTASKKYFSTTAENCFRFVNNEENFIESHTAIEDAEIESKIFAIVHKKTKGKFEMGIIYFPFRILGYAQ
jgi:hypothetical protein